MLKSFLPLSLLFPAFKHSWSHSNLCLQRVWLATKREKSFVGMIASYYCSQNMLFYVQSSVWISLSQISIFNWKLCGNLKLNIMIYGDTNTKTDYFDQFQGESLSYSRFVFNNENSASLIMSIPFGLIRSAFLRCNYINSINNKTMTSMIRKNS